MRVYVNGTPRRGVERSVCAVVNAPVRLLTASANDPVGASALMPLPLVLPNVCAGGSVPLPPDESWLEGIGRPVLSSKESSAGQVQHSV